MFRLRSVEATNDQTINVRDLMILPVIQLVDVELMRDDPKTVRAPQPLVHESIVRCESLGVTLPGKTQNIVLGDRPIEITDVAAFDLFGYLLREETVAKITVQQGSISKLGYINLQITLKQREAVSGIFPDKVHGRGIVQLLCRGLDEYSANPLPTRSFIAHGVFRREGLS